MRKRRQGIDKTQRYPWSVQRFGVIRWAVTLAASMTSFSVFAFLAVNLIQLYLPYTPEDSLFLYSIVMYTIVGTLSGAVTAVVTGILYRRMGRLLEGFHAVEEGNLDVQISVEGAGEYQSLYETFNAMVRELKLSQKRQNQFMNDFSHEFKTPITSIKGFATYLLEQETSEEEQKEYLEVIAEESGRLAELSQNMLYLTRLETQELMWDQERYRLDEQIRRCVILLLKKSEEKKQEVKLSLLPVEYYGNSHMMQQVWINLLDNAIKYTPKGGHIRVSLRVEKDRVLVCVSDDGIGMPEKTMAHIFEKYYQGDVSHESRGYGLGLPIVKRIVELSKGNIEVESNEGRGSTFTVLLNKKSCVCLL